MAADALSQGALMRALGFIPTSPALLSPASGRVHRSDVSPALRRRMEAAVERLLLLLDELDGDPDAEPALGAPEIEPDVIFMAPDGRWFARPGDQQRWANGGGDDREFDLDLLEDDIIDHGEPSIS